MTPLARRRLVRHVIVGLVAGAVARGAAQTASFVGSEAAMGVTVRDAPYTAEATTTLTQTLGDGNRIERTTTARLYRDRAGRVRRELTVMGLAALNPAAESQLLITIVDPVAGVTHVLDPRTRTARRMGIDPRTLSTAPPPPPPPPPGAAGLDGDPAAPPPPPPPPPRPSEEALGTRTFAGIQAVGRRSRTTIPAGYIGNERPIEIVDERWQSPDLRVLAYSRHDDPRTGTVEYRLVSVARAEPPADLFSVPGDYTIVSAAPPPPPAPPAPRGKQ